MSEEEYIRNRLDQININSHYGLMVETTQDLARIWNVGPGEIWKIVEDYIGAVTCDFKQLQTYPKPPIYIKPVKLMTLRDRIIEEAAKELQNKVDKLILQKEDNKMKATSVQNIKNVKDVCFDISNDPIERESKLTIIASTNDDIFAFEFKGQDLLQSCKRAGLFTGWEKDQKIRELEKENKELKAKSKDISDDNALLLETNKKLKQSDMLDKEAADYWSKEHDTLLERFRKLQVENKKLKDKLENVEPFRSLERTIKEKQQLKEEYEEKIDVLQRKYNLEKSANEAQHKFFRQYAGKGTEIEFNYAIDDVNEVSYMIVDKDYIDKLRKEFHDLVAKNTELETRLRDTAKEGDYVYLGSIPYSADDIKKLKEKITKLEALKTPTIENFADEEPADNVNHPSHYTGRYECIDVMQDVFGDEATDNFCLCNAFKYIWRARKKNGLEDVKKAVWYLNKYIEEAEKDGVRKGEQIQIQTRQ